MSGSNISDNVDFEQTLEYIFQQAIKAERKAWHLYLQFSKVFAHVPQVSTFWGGLAQDEEQHARELEKIQGSLTNKQLAQVADRELLTNISNVSKVLREISPDLIDTLDDAYEVAHELEFSEVNSVFKILTTEFISEETRRKATMSHLVYHQGKLMKFTENFGDRVRRKGVTAQHFVHKG